MWLWELRGYGSKRKITKIVNKANKIIKKTPETVAAVHNNR